MLAEVVTGTLVEVVTTTGHWLAIEAMAYRGKRSKEDAAIAEWFDTYKFVDVAARIPELPHGVSVDELAKVLRGNEFQAILHELLAARLTDAPELAIKRIKIAFNSTMEKVPNLSFEEDFRGSLFQYYDLEIGGIVGRLQGGQPELFRRIREDAFSARIIAILNSIESHASAIANKIDPETTDRAIANYRRHVRDYHGKIQPPDFDRRQRIPITDLYVSPSIVQVLDSDRNAISPEGTSPRQSVLFEFDTDEQSNSPIHSLSDLAKQLDRTVLLGDPGGGKSTASNVLMHEYANKENEHVPFLVILRDFASESRPSRSIVDHIEHRLETTYQCAVIPGLVRQLLLSGTALVIFDGLDELVDTSRRVEVTEIVEQFSVEYPLSPVLVTSRFVGYDQARLDDRQFVCFRLNGFDDEQVRSYVAKWFGRDSALNVAEKTKWVESFLEESASVPDLRSNPLMLALMCILYHGEGSIPSNRPEVYQQCAELLFRKWDARRQISAGLRARYLIEPALRHLAYWLFTRSDSQSAVTERELIRETARFFHQRGFETIEEATEAAEEFIQFCRGRAWVFSDAGTTGAGEALYTFTHRTFLEYFTAAHLATTTDTPEKLAQIILPHVAKQEWELVAELAVQKKNQTSDRGAERAILAMLQERRRRSIEGRSNVLRFLARCISFIEVAPRVVRELAQASLRHFDSGSPDNSRYFSPLCELLLIPGDRRDIVRDEINKWGKQEIDAEQHDRQLKALRLLTYIDDGVSILTTLIQAPEPRRMGQARDYWSAVANENKTQYSNLILASSRDDGAMLRQAIHASLITVREVLSWGPDEFSKLFTLVPLGIFDMSWGSYLPWCLRVVLETEPQVSSPRLDDLISVGEYLQNDPEIPWCRAGVDSTNLPVAPARAAATSQLDPVAYLGMAAVLCIMVEAAPDSGYGLDTHLLQQLPGLGTYVKVRIEGSSQDLPSLPLPREFESTFAKWARREINFTAKPDST